MAAMIPSTSPMSGTFPLFRALGIAVHLHWSWLLVAAFELQNRNKEYTSLVWNVAEYLTLFGIVLLHEFGHALACRSVGGQADHIVLWPLGGVAFVNPPPRPGAFLWSIVGGPLVNVILVPLLFGVGMLADSAGLSETNVDFDRYLIAIWYMNLMLLIFNLLPAYPLDGGQILYALLWYAIGRARAILIASAIGVVVAALALGFAFYVGNLWIGVLAVFIGINAWGSLQRARQMNQWPSQ